MCDAITPHNLVLDEDGAVKGSMVTDGRMRIIMFEDWRFKRHLSPPWGGQNQSSARREADSGERRMMAVAAAGAAVDRLAPAGCRTAFARTRFPANTCAHRLRLLPTSLPMTRAPHAGTMPLLKPTPEPYIPQEPRTPSPSGGPVQRGLPDAADIGSAVMLRCGVG